MTVKANGETVCDRCGGDCENGAIDKCAVVSDLRMDDPGHIANYHFCRAEGCDRAVISKSALKHFLATTKPLPQAPPTPQAPVLLELTEDDLPQPPSDDHPNGKYPKGMEPPTTRKAKQA